VGGLTQKQHQQQGKMQGVVRMLLRQRQLEVLVAAGVGGAGAGGEAQAAGAALHPLHPMVMLMARLVPPLLPLAHPQQQAAAGAAVEAAVVAAGAAAALQHSGELLRWLLQPPLMLP
jgi:hypothetical protein